MRGREGERREVEIGRERGRVIGRRRRRKGEGYTEGCEKGRQRERQSQGLRGEKGRRRKSREM